MNRGDLEDLGGTGRGETMIKVYCMKKIYSIKNKLNKKISSMNLAKIEARGTY